MQRSPFTAALALLATIVMVAGCGNDAAPSFRIFNPVTQAEKFDPDGSYVRRWTPTPRAPIVDLKLSRERALAAFKAV